LTPTGRARRKVVVWDFDGTVYTGPAPCMRYAEEIALTMAPRDRPAYLAAVRAFLAGEGGVDASDGWEAVVRLAGEKGGTGQAYAQQFAATRQYMQSEACPLIVPEGLLGLLERLRPLARLVLVSNTPATGVLPLLERLGLSCAFDEIVCEAGKPEGFVERLRCWDELAGPGPAGVLSVGDHFVNDIAPALRARCAAAYIDPFAVGPKGLATMEAASLDLLAGKIEKWAAQRPLDHDEGKD